MRLFRPAKWLPGGHLPTLYGPLCRSAPALQRRRERLILKDGDFIDLDWYGPAESSQPCVILLHGLTGSSSSLYILGQQKALADRGWQSVAVNWRGCSGEPNHVPRGYHSGASDDLAEVVTHVHTVAAGRPLAAAGYSLGGNVLLKYLGERASDSLLQAAVAVSVPFRLDQCADRLQVGFSRVYQTRFLRDMLAYVANKRRLFAHQGWDVEYASLAALGSLEGMDSFWDFDARVTAPLHGYASAEDYYRRCSSRFFLGTIAVPTLIIQALNDPFVYPHSLPEQAELSPCTHFELHAGGGHVGFVEGSPGRPRFYLERRLPEWFAAQFADQSGT
ncbi:hydrolase [Halopseudomonas sp.]|jgi:predicted alpha/beta-fold hydrolase|uniref:hydrolase n=1 Tax=Halopseudomonas sp. TaxID=2901191 RepID=UPI0039E320CE